MKIRVTQRGSKGRYVGGKAEGTPFTQRSTPQMAIKVKFGPDQSQDLSIPFIWIPCAGARGPNIQAIFYCSFTCSSRELDFKWNIQNSNQHAYRMPELTVCSSLCCTTALAPAELCIVLGCSPVRFEPQIWIQTFFSGSVVPCNGRWYFRFQNHTCVPSHDKGAWALKAYKLCLAFRTYHTTIVYMIASPLQLCHQLDLLLITFSFFLKTVTYTLRHLWFLKAYLTSPKTTFKSFSNNRLSNYFLPLRTSLNHKSQALENQLLKAGKTGLCFKHWFEHLKLWRKSTTCCLHCFRKNQLKTSSKFSSAYFSCFGPTTTKKMEFCFLTSITVPAHHHPILGLLDLKEHLPRELGVLAGPPFLHHHRKGKVTPVPIISL